jgi:hypothetical protein
MMCSRGLNVGLTLSLIVLTPRQDYPVLEVERINQLITWFKCTLMRLRQACRLLRSESDGCLAA